MPFLCMCINYQKRNLESEAHALEKELTDVLLFLVDTSFSKKQVFQFFAAAVIGEGYITFDNSHIPSP